MRNMFQDEVGRELRNLPNGYAVRFYDRRSFGVPFPKQPADYLVVHKGRVWFLECKSCHQPSFPFKNVQEHQLLELERATTAGARALFLVCDRRTRGSFRLYCIEPEAMRNLMSGDRRSATWASLAAVSVFSKVKSPAGWDLAELFENDRFIREETHG